LIAAICGVVVVLVVYWILVMELLGPQMDVRGQFGDLFGGVTALFTGLAFAGLIYTILLQSNELELQRAELRLNREAVERSADAQSEQVERLEKAAELSAISTLVSTYGTLLQPVRDATHELHVEVVRLELRINNPDINSTQRQEASQARNDLKREIRTQYHSWTALVEKEQNLVQRLETLVGQRAQGNGAAQKPE
jgi:hypothetical protein